ncbi:pancreatic triacylglycerol lipase isoform X3 [Chelonus insularis]|uniref:pancreatic triacylglycerol lipase isoform X3 n=1 Tax=Chelonus insularis TaxID=460826 RepID=UPI0015887270|nr:pancreatic triacylglycerol lipase isoform X3 [Chelonus insularis]
MFTLFQPNRAEPHILESPLREKYDSYGEDWIFMPDGNDNPQVAILKGSGPELVNRGFLSEEVSFILYTRSGPENGTALFTDNPDALRNSDFSPFRQTKFITHGWKSSALAVGPTNLKNAYLKKGDYNVILVDWEPLASNTWYLGPMKNTEKVGAEAGKFIDYLISETGLSLDNIHFLGHSLGAHVAGNAGYSVTSGKISRITGLDPALPGFHALSTKDNRLDSSDAQFVDVIHSCGGILGFLQPLGTVDFYPNGGVAIQPGCCCMPEITEACSHGRAYTYYTESIISETGLLATKCSDWGSYVEGRCNESGLVFMGEFVDRSATGSYFLRTQAEPPFAMPWQSGSYNDECNEPGGWHVNPDGTRSCGTNLI